MRFPRRQFLYLTVGAATLPAFGGVAGAQTYPTGRCVLSAPSRPEARLTSSRD